ncbi:MAG: HAD-IIB family hydrolase [Spirochaetales bacterium]|nr:HAD-IIB family hydrolase [Spirochaetales bacterium]
MRINNRIPKPLSELKPETAAGITFVLTDVDDTITSEGLLLPSALESIWVLHENAIRIIPVTGGSAGWADVYFRQWPVDAVIAESGALAWYRENGIRKRVDHPSICQEGYHEKAERLIKRVLAEVPGSKLSVDQFCRIYDIAFDHHDETPYLSREGIEHIKRICSEEGASTGLSSIHVNCWFGSYSKLEMVKYILHEVYNLQKDEMKRQVVYCGDAPNDSPLFDFFPLSFGVANVLSPSLQMPSMPAFYSEHKGGIGFSEIVTTIISCIQDSSES